MNLYRYIYNFLHDFTMKNSVKARYTNSLKAIERFSFCYQKRGVFSQKMRMERSIKSGRNVKKDNLYRW